MAYQPRGWYFEDFQVGQQIVTAGRTVTEADIVAFAGLSGDYNQIHTDAEFAARTPFGQRIAHGLLVMSIASGLAAQTGFTEGTVIAFREIKDWKFAKPVYIGDTIHVEITITETKLLRRLGGGSVTFRLDVKNQRDETVMRGTWVVLMASRPDDEKAE
ncbi:MAG: dehydratase [Chloroflexi bacterium]|nr:dehydratase [Chloroflexota bacterium]